MHRAIGDNRDPGLSQVCSLRSRSQWPAGEDRAGAQEPGWGHWGTVKNDLCEAQSPEPVTKQPLDKHHLLCLFPSQPG